MAYLDDYVGSVLLFWISLLWLSAGQCSTFYRNWLAIDFLAYVWDCQIFRNLTCNLTQFTKYIRRLLRFPSSLTSDMAQLTDLHEQEVQTIWNHFLPPVSTACHRFLKSSYSSITCSLCTVSINSVSKKISKELLPELIKKSEPISLVKYECWNITREFFHLQ